MSSSDITVDTVSPAFNEEASLPLVLADIPRPPVRRMVVADNNSSDDTARVAADGGAVVVDAPIPGYGAACLAGLAYLRAHDPPEIVVFLDADYSDHPDELPRVIAPILAGEADMVIGSRTLGKRERGALLPQARMGNLIACTLVRLLYGHRYTDLGPFRAITWQALERLRMQDQDFGWTAEMQVKAIKHKLRVVEVPVSYRRRIGVSKITGTVKGTILGRLQDPLDRLSSQHRLSRAGSRAQCVPRLRMEPGAVRSRVLPKKMPFRNSLLVPYQNALKLGLSTICTTVPCPTRSAITAGLPARRRRFSSEE